MLTVIVLAMSDYMYVSVNIWFLCFVIAAVCCCIHVCSVTGEISERKRRRRAKTTAALFKELFEFSRRVQSAPWFGPFYTRTERQN